LGAEGGEKEGKGRRGENENLTGPGWFTHYLPIDAFVLFEKGLLLPDK
jgi:hypothetical protein